MSNVSDTRIVSYRIGTVGAGCCLYAHIYIHNIINDTITPRITSTSGSQKWCLRLYKTSWLDQYLSNRFLKQLIDGASTTKDGKELRKLTVLSVKKYFLILEYILVTYRPT